ncbi:YihY/virulence factor BrkB family protein [Chroococcidiopsis sp. TS-821]|uniref:YihY/virulence factor BrkB family protein n=1 Tax=Chroococcidiopsis sp. TS-821 TaxID=1378066 RepID=UPI000CED89BD|nr:YihY/virulence factor BrkB family protein [Chroococcidiopsis sp. TS-821]PPS42278.1 ribonuclease BN [Chroococcidiopsis sp. TS-821]
MKLLRNLWQLLKETISEWQFNQVSLLAASLAYYTVFSIVPLMILVIMMVGAIYGEAAAKQQLVEQIQGVVGPESAEVIATAIANMRQDAAGGPFQLIFNLAFFAFGASGVFAQIQNALDKIWEVKPVPGKHITHFLRKRLVSFAMVLVIAFLLLVSFVANTVLASVVHVLNELTPGRGYWWQILSFVFSFCMITFLFAAMYTVLPDAKVRWRDALVGSIFTTVLFMLGQYFFGLFLSQTNFASAYGVAGSFLIIITWIYYAAHILFLGAEFTKVYAKEHGAPIVPEEYAIPISEDFPQETQKRKSSPGLLTNFRRKCMRAWHSLIGRR